MATEQKEKAKFSCAIKIAIMCGFRNSTALITSFLMTFLYIGGGHK